MRVSEKETKKLNEREIPTHISRRWMRKWISCCWINTSTHHFVTAIGTLHSIIIVRKCAPWNVIIFLPTIISIRGILSALLFRLRTLSPFIGGNFWIDRQRNSRQTRAHTDSCNMHCYLHRSILSHEQHIKYNTITEHFRFDAYISFQKICIAYAT